MVYDKSYRVDRPVGRTNRTMVAHMIERRNSSSYDDGSVVKLPTDLNLFANSY